MNNTLWKAVKNAIKNKYLKQVNSETELRVEIKRQISTAKLENRTKVMTICANQGALVLELIKDEAGKVSCKVLRRE